ncbi:MAG: hypothetical protein AAF767_04165 [Pseudomonadota bacterium]
MAAPWTQDRGGLYTRVSIAEEQIEGLRGWRADAYAEYGVTDRLTLTGKLETLSYSDAADFNSDAWRATLRYHLLSLRQFRFSAELGALQGAAIGGRNGCEALGGEARLGGAWSGGSEDRQMFAFAETAGRFHGECNRQRYEFGIGQQITQEIWSITQFWRERGNTNANSDKIQSELLWRAGATDYSIGYRNENGGFFREEAVFAAIATRF